MKKIRLGIFGAGRGMRLSGSFQMIDALEIVAICDNHKQRREDAVKHIGGDIAEYECFDEFIEHPMDAVFLANNFHQHARYAIRCMEKGLHVLSECLVNGTMGEGVELVRAFEKSNVIYMIAENTPQMIFNREIKRVVDGGTLGKIVYAESEYNHAVDVWDTKFTKTYKFYPNHWRNFLPATYYITHSLGSAMYITGATPKRVSAIAMYAPVDDNVPNASHNADVAANISTVNDDGSMFRVTACSQFGGGHNSSRVCGTKGQIENIRGMDDKVMLRYNPWNIPEGAEEKKLYLPEWNDSDLQQVNKSEHGEADFLTVRLFAECVLENKQPPHPFDIYSATVMSSVAILGHRSVLEGGKFYDVPDFRREQDRKTYEKDYLTPFWDAEGNPPTLPCCSNPDYKPTEKQMELYFKELEK